MAQNVDGANLGINMYAKGDEHLTTIMLTNSHSVQPGYNGWTTRRRIKRMRDGENTRFEHRIKNGIWELTKSDERDPVGVFREESVANKNQKKAVPIIATDNNNVKEMAENSTRLNETTTASTNISDPNCSPNILDYCIHNDCTAARPNCLIVNGTASCSPRTDEGWRLSSCPESLSYTGPYRKENETCVLLTTPTDPMTLTKLLSVILKTTNETDGYSTEPLEDYGNCDPSLYCDSTSTPSVCRPKLSTQVECESSNQCQSGRCLEKLQDGTGPKVCLDTNENSDQPSPTSISSSSDNTDNDDSNVSALHEKLKLILITVLPISVGILIIIALIILVVRLRRREMRNRNIQVSYPKEILFQDSPRTTWTNLTRSFTTIRESIIRFSQFSRTADTDDQERRASAAQHEQQQERRDSNRQSPLLPPPPKLTNSLMWMQTPHPLKPVYERIRAVRSSPTHQEDFGTAGQNPAGSTYTPAFVSSSDSERIYQEYI
ncbi:8741_t:CDS:2 [Paraglomus occultum]|uniref:8741_t:CDS:1 n=1 Tax=Paraglomus occultum TaxID=144539 RepID=A0A9N8ZVR3_9GLOM|nr:8741_t:CDS:2 [Paraglomus occultum]